MDHECTREERQLVLWALDLVEELLPGTRADAPAADRDLDRVVRFLETRGDQVGVHVPSPRETGFMAALRSLRDEALRALARLADADRERTSSDLVPPYASALAAGCFVDREARGLLQAIEARHHTNRVLGEPVAVAA